MISNAGLNWQLGKLKYGFTNPDICFKNIGLTGYMFKYDLLTYKRKYIISIDPACPHYWDLSVNYTSYSFKIPLN